MTDQFTLQQFKDALPKHKVTGVALWLHLGIVDGENMFLIPVGIHGAAIAIRSSIDSTGVSAPTGEDSIRAYIVKAAKFLDYRQNEQWKIEALGAKTQKFITRVPGWEVRLTKVLKVLYKLALHVKPCPQCGDIQRIVKVKKGQNKGKYAVCCSGPCNVFRIIEENQAKALAKVQKVAS